MSFDPAHLHSELARLPVPGRYCVAYSGGCDSHVLLHALAVVRQQLDCQRLVAFHIHHGLHPDADDWTRHCERVCTELGIPIEISAVDVNLNKGESLEAAARTARYQAFKRMMQPGDLLLLAHHRSDQAETLLLQLLRGAGASGLAAMPTYTKFGTGALARPCLSFERDELITYAKTRQLVWIEDPSNTNIAFDRNYLRHAIFPILKERWPAVTSTLSRAAAHQAEAAHLLQEFAHTDFSLISTRDPGVIRIEPLLNFSAARQVNVIRYWLKHICGLSLPGTVQLSRIFNELLTAREDRSPIVHWPGAEVRRYRAHLYAGEPLPVHDANWCAPLQSDSELRLPFGGRLVMRERHGRGLHMACLKDGLSVRFRRGGEVCQLPGRHHHHELKKLFQDWGVPPWLRGRIPLIYAGEQLAQVVGYGSCAPFAVEAEETGIEFQIQP